MIYQIKWNFYDYVLCIIIFVLMLIGIILMKNILKKNIDYPNNVIAIVICFLLFMGVVLIASFFQKIYYIYRYNHKEYSVVTGNIQDFQYIYENNGNGIRGIRFSVDKIFFEIDSGIFNAGYKYSDYAICESDYLKIYYIESDFNDKNTTILRIDNMNYR